MVIDLNHCTEQIQNIVAEDFRGGATSLEHWDTSTYQHEGTHQPLQLCPPNERLYRRARPAPPQTLPGSNAHEQRHHENVDKTEASWQRPSWRYEWAAHEHDYTVYTRSGERSARHEDKFRTHFVISTTDTHTLPSLTNTFTHLVKTKQLRSDEHSVQDENQRQQSTHKNVNNTLDIVSGKKTPAHPTKQPNHTKHNSLPILTHTHTHTATCSQDENEKEENTFMHTSHQHTLQYSNSLVWRLDLIEVNNLFEIK